MRLSSWLIVIPARLHSTRLAQKPLCLLGGQPLIVRTFENLMPLVDLGAEIIVATDAERVYEVCRQNHIPVMMTLDAVSGTDRVFQVALQKTKPFVLNVQGDEPFVEITDLIKLMDELENDPIAQMGSLYFRSDVQEEFTNPHNVKVILDRENYALYFSREAIPYQHKNVSQDWSFCHHIGVYAFRRQSLVDFCTLQASTLEKAENLEQLRALENGFRIKMVEAHAKSLGIDTPQDLERAEVFFVQKKRL